MLTGEDFEELQMYLSECREHLETIESDLLEIETAGANINLDLVNKVFRAAHSIKGGAGFFSLKRIQELAHMVENVLDLVRSGKIVPNPEIINLLLLSFDALKDMVNDYEHSNQYDISELVVALTGLTSSSLPGQQKEQVKNTVKIQSPSGRVAFEVVEFDLARAREREEYVYLVEMDLIHDVHQRGQTPWEVFKTYLACGTLLECGLNFEAVGTLDDEPSNSIPLDMLFASVIDPSFIHSLFEDMDREKITLIQGPAHPQALLHPVQDAPGAAEPEPTPAAGSAPTGEPEQTSDEPPEEGIESQSLSAVAAETQTEKHQTVDETLRVNVNLLEDLMSLVGEMVLSRNQLENAVKRQDMEAVQTSSQRVSQITSELQETVMLTRMQPIGNILSKFSRLVRDLSRERGKEIILEIYGKDVELDKSLLEGLNDPLTHMIRNAVDHGIEPREQRVQQGKPPTGKVIVRAYHAAGHVLVEISDDGKGIDPHKVAQAALKKGLLTEEQARLMSDDEKTALIFLPGLSTASNVSDVSGRGVGMDVVKTNLDKLGGKIQIESQPGKGTLFRITLPLTLAIIPSLLVAVNQEIFALPQVNVSELIHISAAQAKTRLEVVGDAEVLVLRDQLIPILRLADLLGIPREFTHPLSEETLPDRRQRISDRRSRHSDPFTGGETQPAQEANAAERRSGEDRRYHAASDIHIAIIHTGMLEYGLVIDELHDTFETVVRPLGQHLKSCREYTGASVMGDGRVALILDPSSLAARVRLNSLSGSARADQLKKEAAERESDLVDLLLFHNAPQEFCALPVDKVERIEYIERSQVEIQAGKRSMQYRGRSLPLHCLQDSANLGEISESADLAVLVVKNSKHPFGILAAQPVDIVSASMVFDAHTHRQPGILGSSILNGQTTLMIDVDELARILSGEPVAPAENAAAAPGPQAAPDGAGLLVLVEDSSFFRSQVKNLLEQAGYRVLAASDGQEGLALLHQHAGETRLVVTDIEMPVMNGLEMTRNLKADPALAHLPVIALTTLADEKDIAAGMAVGVEAYEIKLDKESLLQTVQRILQPPA